jgi:hypothetical protein
MTNANRLARRRPAMVQMQTTHLLSRLRPLEGVEVPVNELVVNCDDNEWSVRQLDWFDHHITMQALRKNRALAALCETTGITISTLQ